MFRKKPEHPGRRTAELRTGGYTSGSYQQMSEGLGNFQRAMAGILGLQVTPVYGENDRVAGYDLVYPVKRTEGLLIKRVIDDVVVVAEVRDAFSGLNGEPNCTIPSIVGAVVAKLAKHAGVRVNEQQVTNTYTRMVAGQEPSPIAKAAEARPA